MVDFVKKLIVNVQEEEHANVIRDEYIKLKDELFDLENFMFDEENDDFDYASAEKHEIMEHLMTFDEEAVYFDSSNRDVRDP